MLPIKIDFPISSRLKITNKIIKEIRVNKDIIICSGKNDHLFETSEKNDELLKASPENKIISSLSCQATKLSLMSCSCIATQYWSNSGVKRYTKDNFNLNLSYITTNIIAMAHPGKEKFSLTENLKGQVISLFSKDHMNRVKIYNL